VKGALKKRKGRKVLGHFQIHQGEGGEEICRSGEGGTCCVRVESGSYDEVKGRKGKGASEGIRQKSNLTTTEKVECEREKGSKEKRGCQGKTPGVSTGWDGPVSRVEETLDSQQGQARS